MDILNDQSHSSDSLTVLITPQDHQEFQRLDQVLAHKLSFLSRTLIKRLFESGEISWSEDSPVQDKKISLSKLPPIGSLLVVNVPPPIPSEALAENIPLDILYEDENLLLVNKPAGLVTHPAPGNLTGTLVNALLYHCPDLKSIGGVKRPGIVHRLDKGTSGVMVVAKTHKCHEELVVLFSKHQLERVYEGVVFGHSSPSRGLLESTIGRHTTNRLKMMANPPRGGKRAVTHYKVLQRFGSLAHFELKLETGRTHQIRVHLSSLLKTPLLMDSLYGKPKDQIKSLDSDIQTLLSAYPYPLLHAKTLGFIHPITHKELKFTVPAPALFCELLTLLQSKFKAV